MIVEHGLDSPQVCNRPLAGVYRDAPSCKIKKPLHLNQKGRNGHVWLFLPSTVLTVSGSRGLLHIADLRLSIAD